MNIKTNYFGYIIKRIYLYQYIIVEFSYITPPKNTYYN